MGGSPKGLVRNLLLQLFTLDSSKIEVLQTYFFHFVITQNDHPRYVKYVLGRIYVVFTLFVYWAPGRGGGSPKGLVLNPLLQFFTLDSSKIEVLETYFFHVVITQNDYPRYVKYVLGRINVVFTLFVYWAPVGGGVLPRDWYSTRCCSFHPELLKN